MSSLDTLMCLKTHLCFDTHKYTPLCAKGSSVRQRWQTDDLMCVLLCECSPSCVNIKAAKWPALCASVCACFQGDEWQGGGLGPDKRLTKPSWLHYWAHWLCTDELKSRFGEAHTHFLLTHRQRDTHTITRSVNTSHHAHITESE